MLALSKIIALILAGFVSVGLLAVFAMFAPAFLGAVAVITIFTWVVVTIVSDDH